MISSFSTFTVSSKSPLHTGQQRISIRSRFIDRGKHPARLKAIARRVVRPVRQKPLATRLLLEDRAHDVRCELRGEVQRRVRLVLLGPRLVLFFPDRQGPWDRRDAKLPRELPESEAAPLPVVLAPRRPCARSPVWERLERGVFRVPPVVGPVR